MDASPSAHRRLEPRGGQGGFDDLDGDAVSSSPTVMMPSSTALPPPVPSLEQDGILPVLKYKKIKPIDLRAEIAYGLELGSGAFGVVMKCKFRDTGIHGVARTRDYGEPGIRSSAIRALIAPRGQTARSSSCTRARRAPSRCSRGCSRSLT